MDWLIDPEIIIGLLGEAFASDFMRSGAAFALAAWIHSARVRKEIRSQMEPLTQSIKDLGAALRQDLAVLSERTGKVEEGLTNLKDRVKTIETKER